MSSWPSARPYGRELLGVKRQDVVPLALLSMDYWSHVIAAEEDDQGSPVLGKGSSSTASLQRQISQEIRRVGRLASPR